MRALLPGVPVRRLGGQIARASNRIGDDRSGRRSLSEGRHDMRDGKGLHRSLLLVGCGKMGTAMLRGWLAGGAISRFYVVEPEGMPPGLAPAPEIEWHTTADTLPLGLALDAVVF